MTSIIGVSRIALIICAWMLPATAFAVEPPEQPPEDGAAFCDVITLQVENDEVGGTDRHYTGGMRLACAGPAPRFVEQRLRPFEPDTAIAHHRASYGIGQNIYTPEDTSDPDLIEDDQPYAGWLYLDFGIDSEVRSASGDVRYLDNLGLQLGVIGPLSGAEQVQHFVHKVLSARQSEGWDNQLDNEPGVNLFYSRQWTGAGRYALPLGSKVPELAFDVTPKAGAALGNVYIYGAGGMTVRFGHFSPNDHGPSAIRPSFAGPDGFARDDGWSAYLFGGVEGRLVGRNIFLDGNSFDNDSPSVDKNRLVGETRLGMALTYGALHLAYTHVFRSQEFEGQDPQTFGNITLSIGL
jgi:lipid A 3-O-deacylase